MKFYHSLAFLLLSGHGVDAWSQPQNRREALKIVQQAGWIPVAFGLAPVASANGESSLLSEQPTTVVAAGAYQAEDSYFSTDLSLPKYNVENSADLVNVKKAAAPEAASVKQKKAPVKRAVAKEETAEQKAAREAKEAKALARAEEAAKEKYAKEMAVYNRKLADQEKAAKIKAERAALQQKRLEFKQS